MVCSCSSLPDFTRPDASQPAPNTSLNNNSRPTEGNSPLTLQEVCKFILVLSKDMSSRCIHVAMEEFQT